MRRLTPVVLTAAALLLPACSSSSDTPGTPAPAVPASSPASPSATTDPVLTRWVGVACSPEGATARTTSGGALVCKKVGSDPAPEWHAVAP